MAEELTSYALYKIQSKNSEGEEWDVEGVNPLFLYM